MDPPLPPLRRRLDQQGSFKTIGPQEIVLDPILRGDTLALEVTKILDLKVEGFVRL
jgi:hypothetical protein